MLLTIQRHRRIEDRTGLHLRVHVDGADVTSRCMSADDGQGWALCYVLNEHGRPQLNPHRRGPLAKVLHGAVTFNAFRRDDDARRSDSEQA